MKTKVITTIMLTLFLLVLATVPVQATIINVVTPEFEDHDIPGAVVDFSTARTILGEHSVLMSIPEGVIEGWGLGLNAETRLATGMSRSRGLAMYKDISFKANFLDNPLGEPPANVPYPVQPAVSAPLYVTLILYDRTNEVWVSMIPTTLDAWGGARMSFSEPDENGWRTATPVGGSTALWTAWTFGGTPWPVGWPDNVMTLLNFDAYIMANGLDVVVRKVNIQFGYMHPVYGTTWGTVYVDGLSFADRTLDFEPPA
jgi:hypothetical protein